MLHDSSLWVFNDCLVLHSHGKVKGYVLNEVLTLVY